MLAAARKTETPEGRLHLMRARVRLTPEALRRLEDALRQLVVEHASEDGVETELLLIAAPTEP